MNFNTRLSVVAVILAVVILIGFVLSVPHAREVHEPATKEPAVASTTPAVTLRDSFKKGTHTLLGTVTAPDACTGVSAAASYASSSGAGIALDITLANTEGLCLKVPTLMNFSTTVAAPAGLPIAVRVNGMPATTTAP